MPFEKTEYWKNRMKEKLKSNFGQAMMEIRELEEMARRVNLDMGKINKAVIILIKSYKTLDLAFGEATRSILF